MNCLLHISRRFLTTKPFFSSSSPTKPSFLCFRPNSYIITLKPIALTSVLTTVQTQNYSSKATDTPKPRKKRVSKKKKKKEEEEEVKEEMEKKVVVEKEKEAFYVVRKGDVVGVYKSLVDCQAQVGTVCDPSVSVYKGYSLKKDTEDYLTSCGLKNAVYSVSAKHVNDDIFGELSPCPFEQPASSKGKEPKKISPKRLLESLESDSDAEQLVAVGKHPKLESLAKAETRLTKCVTCTIEFDGASKGNPGMAGAGAILRAEDGSLICRLREGVGIATNNVAEYRAAILGMKHALKEGFKNIFVQGDSKLVTMQVQGLWKTKNENMTILCKEAIELKKKFTSCHMKHVLRAFNSEADTQANLAITLADGQIVADCEAK